MAVDDVEYMEPTPDSRRKFAACVLFGIVVAVAMEFFLLPAMRAHLKSLPPCAQFTLLIDVMQVFTVVMPLVMGSYSVWFARRLLRHGQFPLPGAWIWQRTRVQRGWRVRLRAYVSLLLCVVLLLGAGWAWRLVQRFEPPAQCRHA